MTRFQIVSLTAIIIAGITVAVILHHRSEVFYRETDAVLRPQADQLAAVTTENQRLSNLLESADVPSTVDHSVELARLRNEAEALRKQTNELVQGKAKRQSSGSAASAPESHPPEYFQQLHQLAGSKPREAVTLSSAFLQYASDHEGQAPSNLEQLAPYLPKDQLPLSGTNRFEIVFKGSIRDLEGVADGAVALLRDQQTWTGPDGRLKRVYGMANGSGQIVSSDDNFQSWEAEHVITDAAVGQPGK